MNIDLARTFLEVAETANFNKAAERLQITQSTVSMRIKSLEDELGRPLFLRSKHGAELTAAGVQFHRHAVNLMRLWQQARDELALPVGFRAILSVGGQVSLWDHLVLKWIPWMRDTMPDIAIRADVGLSDSLMRRLAEGSLDVGVMYAPLPRPGLVIDTLFEDELVLVSTSSDTDQWRSSYVYVDWGPEFRTFHSNAFPDIGTPAVTIALGALGLQHILSVGGAGYFPMRVVRPLITEGRLHAIADTPTFRRPAYLVHRPAEENEDWFRTAVQGLRYIASLEGQ